MSGATGGGVTVPTVPVPVIFGGTGVTSSTGTGSTVLNRGPTILGYTLANTSDPTKYFGIDVDTGGTMHFRPQGNDYATISNGGALVLNGGAQVYGLQANPVTINGAANSGQVFIGIDTGVAAGNNVGAVIGNIKGTGAFQVQVTDGTAAGGNARGANAVDLQTSRASANQVANGANSVLLGGKNNISSGQFSQVLGGQWNLADSTYTVACGGFAVAHGIFGASVFASGQIATAGDAQAGTYVLRGRSTGGAAVRLTADGSAVSSINIANIPLNTAWGVLASITARDTSTGNCATWRIDFGLGVAATAGTLVYKEGAVSFMEIIGSGVVTADRLARSGDTANRGVNYTFTPPNSNTWDVVAVFRTSEVQ